MELAPLRGVHGFKHTRHVVLLRKPQADNSDAAFAKAIDKATMDFDQQLLDAGMGGIEHLTKEERVMHYLLKTENADGTSEPLREVEIHLLDPNDVDNFNINKPDAIFPAAPSGQFLDALWIVTGSEIQRSQDWHFIRSRQGVPPLQVPADPGVPKPIPQPNPLTSIDRRIGNFVRQVTATRDPFLRRIVVSVSGFEWAFINARPAESGPMAWRGPLAHAFDPDKVIEVHKALARGAPEFQSLLRTLAQWENAGLLGGIQRLAAVQPISANGFFSDDGCANSDRLTGRPLQTVKGMITTRDSSAIETDLFPASDHELPRWLPYLSVDPLLTVALGFPGHYGFRAGQLIVKLPRADYGR